MLIHSAPRRVFDTTCYRFRKRQGFSIPFRPIASTTYLAKREGLHGFTASVLMDNKPMLQLFEKKGFVVEQTPEAGVYELRMSFRER